MPDTTSLYDISKPALGLYHTKYEAHKIYGEEATCPCCGITEMLDHVFRCGAITVTANRSEAHVRLWNNLSQLKTPDKLLSAVLNGITSWEILGSGENPNPLYRGSVLSEDVTLVQAFTDQTVIGWDQFLCGRISKRWSFAYELSITLGTPGWLRITSWAKQMVKALWNYSVSLEVLQWGGLWSYS